MINEKTKHIELRNKIEIMLNNGLSLEDISIKLGIRIGHQRDRGSVQWFSKCISSKNNMNLVHKKYALINLEDVRKNSSKPIITGMLGGIKNAY